MLLQGWGIEKSQTRVVSTNGLELGAICRPQALSVMLGGFETLDQKIACDVESRGSSLQRAGRAGLLMMGGA